MTPVLLSLRSLICVCVAAATLAHGAEPDGPVLPTVWVIGDSTVKVGSPGQRGWGDELGAYLDPAEIRLINRARSGRSSRTFLTEGRWDAILRELRAGDVVIMQFGHNDSSPINEKPPKNRGTRCRGTIRNNSDETVDIINTLTGKPETVHSYGWYLRHFIATARAKGAEAIACSPVPRKSWSKEGTINRNGESWGLWARQAAEQAGARFIDLNAIIARAYEALGQKAVEPLFGDAHTHTSPAGARLNARCVVSGLNGLTPNPLGFALSAAGRQVPPFLSASADDDRPVVSDSGVAPEMPVTDTIPTLWIAGDSTVKISGGANPMRGWGQEIGAHFDPAKINVVNRAIGGRSSRTFYTEGRWQSILDGIKRGDWVLIQFGHNDVGRPDASSKFRGSLKGSGDETQDVTKPDGTVETVHTYGWYLKTYVRTAREKGANVVLCSPIPHKRFDAAGWFQPNWEGWRQEVESCAKATGAYYIDLCATIGNAYAKLPQAQIESFYADRGTHTSVTGAAFNARALVAALMALPTNPLASYFADKIPMPLAQSGARTTWRFSFGDGPPAPGYTEVTAQSRYSPNAGFGWLEHRPALFAASVPEGNYNVAVRFRDAAAAAAATVKAETRRLMLMAGDDTDLTTRRFTVNVRTADLAGGGRVRLHDREHDRFVTHWDDCLSLEFFPGTEAIVTLDIRPAPQTPTVYLAGDSTVTDQPREPWAGWGQMLPRFFQPGIAVANHAESGRALYSFRWERRLDKILGTIQPGDYLFVQFGHNDQKNRKEGAGPFTTYKQDVEDFVAKAKLKRANPVLVTPMERRRWKGGKPQQTLTDFAQAVRQVGKENGVPVIDLHAMSLELYRALGSDGSARAFVHYPAGTFAGQSEPLKDDTHHSPYGAYELARCVVAGIQEHVPELAKHLRGNAGHFDPARPDALDSIAIPVSRLQDTARPAPAARPAEATGEPLRITADADTFLTNDPRSGPDKAHGREQGMELRRYVGVRQRILYFRFRLTGVEGDLSGATITLNLTSGNRPRKADVYGVVDRAAGGQGEDWDEGTLAYRDAAGFEVNGAKPGHVTTTADLTKALTSFSLPKGRPGDCTAPSTPALDAFLREDTNQLVTFAVILEFSHGVHDFFFRTKEGNRQLAPRLNLPHARNTRP